MEIIGLSKVVLSNKIQVSVILRKDPASTKGAGVFDETASAKVGVSFGVVEMVDLRLVDNEANRPESELELVLDRNRRENQLWKVLLY